MKNIVSKIVSLVLVLAMLSTLAIPVSAARPTAEYLSELKMAQASTADEAKKMLTDAGYKVIDKNLNPNESQVVYLGYKTSKNVEDAITDISIMNMNGGYSITDYNRILEESKTEYKTMTAKYRIAASEFAENYKAGNREAKLAYRQLNYYYFEKNGVKTYMGDYMLNFPTSDEEFADILLKGNLYVLNNLRALLAMGTGSSDTPLADKVAELSRDESIYSKMEYHENAKMIYEIILNAKNKIDATNKAIEKVEAEEALTQEEKTEAIEILLQSVQSFAAFRSLIESYKYKDTTYGEYLNSKNYMVDYSVFYPIVEALTPGQRALLGLGQLSEIVIYDIVRKSDFDLEKELAEIEKEFGEIDVYHGTDLSVFEGSFAFTDDALRYEAMTGDSWMNLTDSKLNTRLMASILLGLGGMVTTAISGILLKDAISAYTALNPQYVQLLENLDSFGSQITACQKSIGFLMDRATFANSKGIANDLVIKGVKQRLETAIQNYHNTEVMIKTAPMHNNVSVWPIIGSSIGVVAGLVMIGFSISNLVKIYNSYNVQYTDIPTNIVDVVDTENGNRFVRYQVVESFYGDGGTVKSRPGDTNAYDGKQWNAIYYTKSYEAGKCLLASYDFPAGENDFGKYTPVHAFGEVGVCYNLNEYSGALAHEKIYLAFQNSSAEKAAASQVPTIVGSVLNLGIVAISAVAGFGLGMGTMAFIKSKKKKLKEIKEEI